MTTPHVPGIDPDDLRPIVHQHVCMLTAAGISPGEALAIAAHVVALVYSKNLEDALRLGRRAIERDGSSSGLSQPME